MLQEYHELAKGHASAEQAEKEAAVEDVRRVLRDAYEQAKRDRPIIQKAIPEYRQFINEINEIVAVRGQYPDQLRGWIGEMSRNIEIAPQQLQAGIDRFDRLSYSHIADMFSRDKFIGETRSLLKSGDGQVTRLKRLRGQAETFLREWLGRSAEGATTISVPPVRERPSKVKVESEFDPRR